MFLFFFRAEIKTDVWLKENLIFVWNDGSDVNYWKVKGHRCLSHHSTQTQTTAGTKSFLFSLSAANFPACLNWHVRESGRYCIKQKCAV